MSRSYVRYVSLIYFVCLAHIFQQLPVIRLCYGMRGPRSLLCQACHSHPRLILDARLAAQLARVTRDQHIVGQCGAFAISSCCALEHMHGATLVCGRVHQACTIPDTLSFPHRHLEDVAYPSRSVGTVWICDDKLYTDDDRALDSREKRKRMS